MTTKIPDDEHKKMNSSDTFNYFFNRDIYLKQEYLQQLESETANVPPTEEYLQEICHSKKKKKVKRWSLQEEIAKLFNTSLKGAFSRWGQGGVSCSISCYPKEDGDYLCTSVLHLWPEFRNTRLCRGPTDAGLDVKRNIMVSDYSKMIERCVVCGPGFVKFTLSRKWIAKSIYKMLKSGVDTWAPKLSVKKAIIYFSSPNIYEEMHTGLLRSAVIGDTLARILEYSKVEVIRRFHGGDELDVNGKRLHDSYISKTLDLLREKGFTIHSEGDDAIFIEGRKLPLTDLAALWHALDVVKADWIVHVTDVGQRDYVEMCISAAKRAGWIVNDHCSCPLSHVGIGLVEGDDFKRLINLLDEAESRCKGVLVGQGEAYEWTAEELEHTAKVLGYAAVKYENLKNNRLTNFTISFDQMLNEQGNTVLYLRYTHAQICSIIKTYSRDIKKLKKLKVEKVEELVLKNDEERLLGLHLLRFTEVLGGVCTALTPHILCEYLFELCNKFNSFHSSVCQDTVEFGDEKSKLLLCEATAVLMKKCFHLLGITPICKKYNYRKEKESETTSAAEVPFQEKMTSFWKAPGFLFQLCNVVLRHNIDATVENGGSYNELRLFGILQAEPQISDPSHYGSFDIFDRNFDDPLVITKPGSLSPHDIQYCSLTASKVKITAKLYGTTYKGDDEMESRSDYTKYYLETGIPPSKIFGGISRDIDPDKVRKRFAEYKKGLFPPLDEERENKKVYIDDDLFEVCDDYAFINFSEYFANRPNGGSGSFKLNGKDGYLEMYYVALKHAVEAALEADFVAPCKETKVVGRVMAYYGNNFCYGCSANEKDLYNAMLFETAQPEVKHGKLNLMRPVLAVPSRFSLIIDANFTDFTSGDIILSGVCEFSVPAVDGSMISVGSIEGNDCALNLKVDWKLPLDMVSV